MRQAPRARQNALDDGRGRDELPVIVHTAVQGDEVVEDAERHLSRLKKTDLWLSVNRLCLSKYPLIMTLIVCYFRNMFNETGPP